MTRLLILTSSFPRWPGDYPGCFVAEFAQSLAGDFQITVLSPPSQGAPAREQFGNISIERFNYLWPHRAQRLDAAIDLQTLWPAHRLSCWQLLPFMICFFWRALRLARQADLICSHWLLPAGLIGSLLALLLNKPHVVIEHSGALHLLRRFNALSGLTALIMRGTKRLVVVSQQLHDLMSACYPAAREKMAVIPMGIAYHDFVPPQTNRTDNNRTVLFLGRLTEVKGVKVLLDAVAGCRDLKLLIAGDGEQRESLERHARSVGAPAEFLGAVNKREKQQLLAHCDLVVIPSIILPDGRSEGTPVVCLEAFAAARAVIASAVGGLPELVIDGESGLLCQPGNAQQLRDKILLLLNDDLRRARLSRGAAEIAAQYDWSIIAARFKSILAEK